MRGRLRPVDLEEIRLRRAELNRGVPVPAPPFWGPQTIARVPVKAVVPYLNERMLYQFQWGYRKDGRSLAEYKEWAQQGIAAGPGAHRRYLDPREHPGAAGRLRLLALRRRGQRRDPVRRGRAGARSARFSFPRQNKEGGLCIADFFRDVDDPERDVIGLQVVTMGRRASEAAREWFAENRYQDYLYLHGLSVEMAEAFAEYVHKRIRGELGFAAEEARDHDEMLNQGYRGSRYSFGYPACPNLADQRLLLDLLRADEIGISLTEEDQLDPEQSTSAIVVHHPQAKYFSV